MHDRAVAATASGAGKNKANAGIRIVPSPNPENSVKQEVKRATTPITMSSMRAPLIHRISLSPIRLRDANLPTGRRETWPEQPLPGIPPIAEALRYDSIADRARRLARRFPR
jgi:hypothetical protein